MYQYEQWLNVVGFMAVCIGAELIVLLGVLIYKIAGK